MTTTINEAYINSLLADASYVTLSENGQLIADINVVKARLGTRLTQPLADFITQNFSVINQEIASSDGFSATVWQGKEGTEYAGQVYVSMRGTAGFQDIADDGQLAATGVAYGQLKDMVADYSSPVSFPVFKPKILTKINVNLNST